MPKGVAVVQDNRSSGRFAKPRRHCCSPWPRQQGWGCGDSSAAVADKSTADKSDAAARLTNSAGDLRANDELIRKIEDIKITELASESDAMAKRAKNLSTKDIMTQYLQQRPAAEDLKMAADLVNQGISGDAAGSSNLQAAMQTQQGLVASSQVYKGRRLHGRS